MYSIDLGKRENLNALAESARYASRVLKVNRRIGDLMREGREEIGLHPRHLAKRFGVSRYDVQRWETGFGTLKCSLFADIVTIFSEAVNIKFQILITDLQTQSSRLRDKPQTIHEIVDNFEALGACQLSNPNGSVVA